MAREGKNQPLLQGLSPRQFPKIVLGMDRLSGSTACQLLLS